MFEMNPRRGVVVWVYSLKQIKALRHYGTVMFVSKRMKYVYLYMDETEVTSVVPKLEALRFVRAVTVSPHPELAMTYGQGSALATLEQEAAGSVAPSEAPHAGD